MDTSRHLSKERLDSKRGSSEQSIKILMTISILNIEELIINMP